MTPFYISQDRESKAIQMESILKDYLKIDKIIQKRILDLGCGSGLIAGYFADSNQVVAADVQDWRSASMQTSFQFVALHGDRLPFENEAFDLVIYNHVINYTPAPLGQLREIHRVLKKNGACYFASANRNFPIEGSTKLPLLHYLPASIFRPIYKWFWKTQQDLYLLGHREMIQLIQDAGFQYKEYTAQIIRRRLKLNVGSWLSPLSPSNVFVLSR
jgi:ubiquinone/menaquinone biosynthesis C-methylase UbiE